MGGAATRERGPRESSLSVAVCRATPMSVPMVLLTIPAKLVADWAFKGIYDWQIEDAEYPYLEAEDKSKSEERAAGSHYQVGNTGCEAPHGCVM